MTKHKHKKVVKEDSIKRSPLMQRQQGLTFDNVSPEELIALTPEQEADRFLSRWMEVVDPFEEYPKVFRESTNGSANQGADVILRFIKLFYKKFVLNEDWSEQKYVLVINNIFESRAPFVERNIEIHGILHDKGDLLSQKRIRRGSR